MSQDHSDVDVESNRHKKDEAFDQVHTVGNDSAAITEQQQGRHLLSYKEGQKLLRRIDWYLVPLMMLIYTLRAMDGSAVSYVKTMNPKSDRNIVKQLHMTTDEYGYTLTVFTVFYAICELPSNLLFKKATPRGHYLRIIILWSIACICQAAAYNEAGLLVARAFLGIFEAGLAPGLYLHLTYWYRPDEVGVRIAAISSLFQLANITDAFLTYGLSFANESTSISGWQWVFIIEGLIGIIIAIICWRFMPNYPETARWLTPEEKLWVVGRLPSSSARKDDKDFDWGEFKIGLFDSSNIAFSVMVMLYQTGLLGYLFWLPTIIAGFGISDTATVQLLNVPPLALYWVGGVSGNWINDRLTMVPRPLCFIFAALLWTLSLFGLAFVRSKAGLYAIVCFASMPAAWGFQTFLPWRIQSVRGATHAAFLIGFISGAGQVPGIYTAQIFRSQYAPRYTIPFMICVAMTLSSCLMALVCWYLTFHSEKETRRISALRRKIGRSQNVVIDEDVELDEEVRHRNDRNAAE